MLINTVIIFIKDILPVFVLFCFIYTYLQPIRSTKKNIACLITASMVGAALIHRHFEQLSDTFSGDGIEIYRAIVNVYIYLGVLQASSTLTTGKPLNKMQNYLLLSAGVMFTAIKVSEFSLFFTTSVFNQQTMTYTFVGSIIGGGICASFCILLVALLKLSLVHGKLLKHGLLLLYINGFLIQSLSQLQQIDLVSTSKILWNTSSIIPDSSEYGYLLNTLFGYVSSPTIEYLFTYGISISLYLLMLVYVLPKVRKQQNDPRPGVYK